MMDPEYIEVSTKQGKIKGLVKKSTGLSPITFYSFQGIPYAKPPVGKLRFKDPEPYGEWEGVRDATQEGNVSVQRDMNSNIPKGDEDCLYINVYTPQLKEKSPPKRAVMVFIHGGGFINGSGNSDSHGPDFLIEEGVVFVTFNYRCGALGFLSLENAELPGNAGLKDQALALRWVRDHIASFGGDPNNVTIFGESAGAASVHYHLLSPLSRGLFHKAIVQSGSALCQWALQTKPKEITLLLAKELGCTSQDPDKVLEFLMTVPVTDILEAQQKQMLLSEKGGIQTFSLVYIPCVEVAGDNPFLPDYPRKLMERGEFSKVPVMLGLTDKEGLLGIALKLAKFEEINKDLSLLVPLDLSIPRGGEEEQKVGQELLKFYVNKETISWDDVHGYIDYVTDMGFTVGLENTRQYLLKQSTSPVYYYLFSYTTPRALSSKILPVINPEKAAELVGCGACHADELPHLFKIDSEHFPHVPPTAEDKKFMKAFVKAWTSFAKSGNPNCDELGVTWKPDNIENPHFLEIGNVFKAVDDIVFSKRSAFWKTIYEKFSYSY